VVNRLDVEQSGPDHNPEPEPEQLDVQETLRLLLARSSRFDLVLDQLLAQPMVRRFLGLR
jgi:hypothetical protein